MKLITYERLMRLGWNSGCHQMPERSSFIKGKQFPVCARCTGVFIGKFVAYATLLIYSLPFNFYVLGCMIMFIDWFMQYIGICESTNIRRFITGIIGGGSLATIYCIMLKRIMQYLINFH